MDNEANIGRFGLEIPGLKADGDDKKFRETVEKNRPLVERVREFLESNGVTSTQGVSYVLGMVTIVA